MSEVELTREGAVATIMLNRPDVLNAFNAAMHRGLGRALEEARDPAVRAVVITGAGRGFCVGQDLNEFQTMDVAESLRGRYHPNVLAIRALEKPVIAAVNGPAAGAGLSLACACDIRVAAESAAFVPAFINIGLVPDSGGSWFVQRLLGTARAFEWMTSGRRLSAAEAQEWGLVSEVVEDEQLAARTAELAAGLAAMPTQGIWLTKRLFDHAETATLERQLDLEAQLQAEATRTDDFKEGVAAFLARRAAVFTGRPRARHPISIRVSDDRKRWRLTVLIRFVLAYPHFLLLQYWTFLAAPLAIAGWFVALVRGRLPDSLHRPLAQYLRYGVHVQGYVLLAADPYPHFRGLDSYPVDLEVEPPQRQRRWKILLRLVLALPALALSTALAGVLIGLWIAGTIVAFLIGRMPKGMRDLTAYAIRYIAQTQGYLLLLTERYPSLASNPPEAETRSS